MNRLKGNVMFIKLKYIRSFHLNSFAICGIKWLGTCHVHDQLFIFLLVNSIVVVDLVVASVAFTFRVVCEIFKRY